jgi:hypothetical protein
MGQSPFSKRDLSPQSRSNRRRSTRIDYETPVVLTGRDATGQTFREETSTLIVNFHGAKVRTKHKVLVGMLVTVESVKTRQSKKAVCVNTYDPSPEHPYSAIALQLVQPGDIWGVENPPLDWAEVAAELGGRTKSPEPARAPVIPLKPGITPPSSPPPPPVSSAVSSAQVAEFEQRAARTIEALLDKVRLESNAAVNDALSTYEQRLATLVAGAESRISQRVEQAAAEVAATIETLRSDAIAEMVQETLQEFQRRLGEMSTEQEGQLSQRAAAVVADAEGRLTQKVSLDESRMNSLQITLEQRLSETAREADRQFEARVNKAFAEYEASLATFRSDLEDELGARREQAVREVEQALRSRVSAMLSTLMGSPAGAAPAPGMDVTLKK